MLPIAIPRVVAVVGTDANVGSVRNDVGEGAAERLAEESASFDVA